MTRNAVTQNIVICVYTFHDSGNVKWTFLVPVGKEDTSSQKGKCNARAGYASIIALQRFFSYLARFDFFFFF